jgi:glycine cleavage system H protein
MPKPLIFMMGRSPAFLPVDRSYARNHMWALRDGEGWRFGLTAFAVRLLGDIRLVGWSIEPPARLMAQATMGYVEASKATSDLYAPTGGVVDALNMRLAREPSLVNTNVYDDGWLLRMLEVEAGPLLSPEAYLARLEAAWPLAQRMLKGQASGSPPSLR